MLHCFVKQLSELLKARKKDENWKMKKNNMVYFYQNCSDQESRRVGWTDARSAVGFCLGSGLFGSYNSD